MSEGPDGSSIGATFGQDFHIARLTFKNHIGCGHTFAAIDGALVLKERHGLAAGDIAGVHVATYRPALDIACHARPATPNEARFSLTYVVATALAHGSVRRAAYEPARLDDPATRALMARVVVAVDPALDAAFPGQRAARVVVETRDGRRLEHLQTHRKGDPEEPLSDLELEGKFLELAGPVLGATAAAAFVRRLWALDAAASLRCRVPAARWVAARPGRAGRGTTRRRRPVESRFSRCSQMKQTKFREISCNARGCEVTLST